MSPSFDVTPVQSTVIMQIKKALSTATAVQGSDNYKLGTATAVLPQPRFFHDWLGKREFIRAAGYSSSGAR